jgi:hypothetical protein
MSIKVLGHKYTVDLSQRLDDMKGNVGVCDLDYLIIKIANDAPPDVKVSTLLHELIEAINYHLELKLKHGQIMGLEVGLYQIFSENGIDLGRILEEREEIHDGNSGKSSGVVLLETKGGS